VYPARAREYSVHHPRASTCHTSLLSSLPRGSSCMRLVCIPPPLYRPAAPPWRLPPACFAFPPILSCESKMWDRRPCQLSALEHFKLEQHCNGPCNGADSCTWMSTDPLVAQDGPQSICLRDPADRGSWRSSCCCHTRRKVFTRTVIKKSKVKKRRKRK